MFRKAVRSWLGVLLAFAGLLWAPSARAEDTIRLLYLSLFPSLPEMFYEEEFKLSRAPRKITLHHPELGDFEVNPALWSWQQSSSSLKLRFLPPSHRRVLELKIWDQNQKLISQRKIHSSFRFKYIELQQDFKIRGRFSSAFFLFRFKLPLPLMPSHTLATLGVANRAGEVFAIFLDPQEPSASSVVFDLSPDGRQLVMSQNHAERDSSRIALFDLFKGSSKQLEFPRQRLQIHHEILFEGPEAKTVVALSESRFTFFDPWEVLKGQFRLKSSWRDSLVRIDLEQQSFETIWKYPWEWSLFKSETLASLSSERGFEWTHANSVFPHPEGWLISVRNLSQIHLISPEGRALRRWPTAPQPAFCHAQHQVSWLSKPDRLLFFQNDQAPQVSSLREVDPFTGKILWEWKGPFHSPFRGSVQVVDEGRARLALFPRLQSEQDVEGLGGAWVGEIDRAKNHVRAEMEVPFRSLYRIRGESDFAGLRESAAAASSIKK